LDGPEEGIEKKREVKVALPEEKGEIKKSKGKERNW